MHEIYKKIREKLDSMSMGFPSTESGVEFKVLENFFTPEHAEIFLAMKDDFQTADEVAACMNKDKSGIEKSLEEMVKKSLLFSFADKGIKKYRIFPFLVGIADFQIDRLNKESAEDLANYMSQGLRKAGLGTTIPVTRILPVNANLVSDSRILPFDDAVHLVKQKQRVSLAKCMCRQVGELLGRPCEHPLETCLQFDQYADYFVENGMARYITKEEAIEHLKRNEGRGLVIEVVNSEDTEIMCSCCKCHCTILMLLKSTAGKARECISNYASRRDVSLCTHCAVCVNRCPSKARISVEGKVQYRSDLCIGCGLCVSTCRAGANKLEQKENNRLYHPEKTLFQTYEAMKKSRMTR